MDCAHCPRTVDTNRGLGIHVSKTHKDTLPVFKTCTECDVEFTGQKSYYEHMKLHPTDTKQTPKMPYKCNMCPTTELTSKAFISHLNISHCIEALDESVTFSTKDELDTYLAMILSTETTTFSKSTGAKIYSKE
jgi:uncharacterized C2H2 Zn-finger protein